MDRRDFLKKIGVGAAVAAAAVVVPPEEVWRPTKTIFDMAKNTWRRKKRTLKGTWSVEAADELIAMHGFECDGDLADLWTEELDKKFVDELWDFDTFTSPLKRAVFTEDVLKELNK